MIAIVCADDKGGIMFNHRRQSQDRKLRKRILDIADGKTLWMSTYSAKQFAKDSHCSKLCIDDDFAWKAENGDFAFFEGDSLAAVDNRLERVIVFRWNRTYPSDQYLDIDFDNGSWKCEHIGDFRGSSHEQISEEVYTR